MDKVIERLDMRLGPSVSRRVILDRKFLVRRPGACTLVRLFFLGSRTDSSWRASYGKTKAKHGSEQTPAGLSVIAEIC